MLIYSKKFECFFQEELDESDISDYGTLQNLPYLDAVIHETLRMHPVIPNLPKICTKQYKIPGTNVVLKPGDMIEINAVGISYDPKYFPNPETFDPENFMKAKSQNFCLLKPVPNNKSSTSRHEHTTFNYTFSDMFV